MWQTVQWSAVAVSAVTVVQNGMTDTVRRGQGDLKLPGLDSCQIRDSLKGHLVIPAALLDPALVLNLASQVLKLKILVEFVGGSVAGSWS